MQERPMPMVGVRVACTGNRLATNAGCNSTWCRSIHFSRVQLDLQCKKDNIIKNTICISFYLFGSKFVIPRKKWILKKWCWNFGYYPILSSFYCIISNMFCLLYEMSMTNISLYSKSAFLDIKPPQYLRFHKQCAWGKFTR